MLNYVADSLHINRHVCAYCGGRFGFDTLTREHIVPTSRGGRDTWMNCITACRACNGNRLPQEFGMSLMYLPYTPARVNGVVAFLMQPTAAYLRSSDVR